MLHFKSVIYLLLCISFISIFSNQGFARQGLDKAIEQQIQQLLEQKVSGESPGVAVGIVRDGEIIFEHYLGYANLSHAVKIDRNTRFNIASNAKQFTALCILKLAEEGKLRLTDDFRKYLPDLYANISDSITIGQLITHTSGIRDVYDLMGMQGKPWWKRVGLKNKHAIKLLKKQQSLNFTPGSDFLYSNSNYLLLTEIVKQVTGNSFKAYTQQVFESLGMKQSSFSTNYMAVIPNQALPYSDWGDGQWQEWPMLTSLHGDGFLYTTLQDQLIWEQVLQQNKHTWTWIKQSQQALQAIPLNTYGFGVELASYKGLPVIQHEGATGSYGAQFMRFPDQNTAVVVLSNSSKVWTTGLAQEIAALVLNLKAEIPTFLTQPEQLGKTPKLSAVLGPYWLSKNTIVNIREKAGELYREIEGRDPVKLIHEQGNVYVYESNPNLKVAFIKNEEKQYDFMLYHPQIAARSATRIEPTTITDYQDLAGTYSNKELDITFTVACLAENRFEFTRGDRTYKANTLMDDLIQMDGYFIHVMRNVAGKAIGFYVDYARVKNVKFTKVD